MRNCLLAIILGLAGLIFLCGGGYAYLYYRYPPTNWQPRFGQEINPTREKLQIPIILPNWEPSVTQYETIWYAPDCNVETDVRQRKLNARLLPCHYAKWVSYWPEHYPKEQKIPEVIEETDIYLGPRYVDVLGRLEREEVTIQCRYNPSQPDWKQCEATAFVPPDYIYGPMEVGIDLETAIRILEAWGLHYP